MGHLIGHKTFASSCSICFENQLGCHACSLLCSLIVQFPSTGAIWLWSILVFYFKDSWALQGNTIYSGQKKKSIVTSKPTFPGQRWIFRSKGSFPFHFLTGKSLWQASNTSEVHWQQWKCDRPQIPMWYNRWQDSCSANQRQLSVLKPLARAILHGSY